ncbi:MAG: hypothetical protein KDA28_10870, partial [Phycisphaerales bacterium]|nr:hypothetical protein [Phycisphaerales bacterium]
GRVDEAVGMFRRVSQDLPFDLFGAYAQGELLRMKGAEAVFSEYTVQARDWRRGVPDWIDRMTADPTSFMTMDVVVDPDTLDGTGGAVLTIRLRNLAPIPLGLGANQPLNSRLLISPALRAGIDPQIEFIRPEVVDIGRRLRLMPRESIETKVWVEPGFTGWFVETCAAHTIRMNWRVIQGFRVNSDGLYVVGPLCLEAATDTVVRLQLQQTRLAPADLAEQITTEPEERLAKPLTALRALLLNPVPDRPLLASTEVQEGMAEVLAARYHGLGRAGRAAMLCNIPTARQIPAFEVFDQTVRHEEDPTLWALMLLTRVADPEDVDLLAAIKDPDPFLSRVASIHRERLRRGARTVSGATKDPRSIRPIDFHE